jgi:hypothetical protein
MKEKDHRQDSGRGPGRASRPASVSRSHRQYAGGDRYIFLTLLRQLSAKRGLKLGE